MKIQENSTDDAAEGLLRSLIGKVPWGIELGAGSILILEFGARDPRQSAAKIHGEWHLWLHMCSWRIEQHDRVAVACEDSRERIRRVLKEVNWGSVSDLKLIQPGLDLEITFQSGQKLRTFSVNGSEDRENEQWLLFTPTLKVIVAKGSKLEIEKYADINN